MRDEAELNTIIKNSLDWASKVPDPAGSVARTASARCFDGFGIHRGKSIYWEAKHLKGLQSFNLGQIAEHQITNLKTIQMLNISAVCLILLGVTAGRGDNRLYVFNDVFEVETRRNEKRKVLKKELDTLPYFIIKKGLIADLEFARA